MLRPLGVWGPPHSGTDCADGAPRSVAIPPRSRMVVPSGVPSKVSKTQTCCWLVDPTRGQKKSSSVLGSAEM